MKDRIPDSDKELTAAWRAADLIAKYIQEEISPDEQIELNEWKDKSTSNQSLFEELTNKKNVHKTKAWLQDMEAQKIKVYEQLKLKISFNPPRQSPRINIWWVAISIIVFVVTATFIYYKNKSTGQSGNDIVRSADIGPGQNAAVLQLSDGTKINLNELKKGKLQVKEVTTINKTAEGIISYNDSARVDDNLFNILTTPLGGQYAIELPDGSKAWLNAGSSLKYPLMFKKERTVEATGEVYFEIKKDKIPFIVKVNEASVEVLGTHFNVDAYDVVKTTLLEGSVRLSKNGQVKILQPGEMGTAGENISIKKLEYPGDVIAWKNGLFRFSKTGIKEIMEQLARWYKMEVRYEGNFEQTTFTVTASRYDNLSTILKNIEKAGHIHFKIEGTNVTVIP